MPIDPLTLGIASCAMMGMNLLITLTVNGTAWYHRLMRWWSASDYNIVKLYRVSDRGRFDMFTIFLDFFLNKEGKIPSTDGVAHLTSYEINGRSYFTILGRTFLKITMQVTEERRVALKLKNAEIDFWIYGIGEKHELPHAYEYWVKPKYLDDANQMFLIFSRLAGYNPIDTGNLFPIYASAVRQTTYQKMISLNRQLINSYVTDLGGMVPHLPALTDQRLELGQKVQALRHQPSALFALGCQHHAPRIDDPMLLSVALRNLVFQDYPTQVSRILAAPLIIRNFPTFIVMKSRELHLDLMMGETPREAIRHNRFALDNFFKTVMKQHADYPLVNNYLELLYFLIQASELPEGDLATIFRSLPMAPYLGLLNQVDEAMTPPPPVPEMAPEDVPNVDDLVAPAEMTGDQVEPIGV